MENEIKKIYTTLSGGKTITNSNYVISSSHFNSISRDRFIVELNKKGFNWSGDDIEFLNLISNKVNDSTNINSSDFNTNADTILNGHSIKSNLIGIDIQEISELPDCCDYWEDLFYTNKFNKEEIAYCVTKGNPKQSFAGIYSCKEALIKADNQLLWDDIIISHNQDGEPYFNNYQISISHSGLYSIAIAMKLDFSISSNSNEEFKLENSGNVIVENFTHNSNNKSNLALKVILGVVVLYILVKELINFNILSIS